MSQAYDIESVERLAAEVEAKTEEIRSNVIDLSRRLSEASRRSGVSYWGERFTVEELDFGLEVYGHLSVDQDGLYLAYRSDYEDVKDHANGVPEEEQAFSVSRPDAWDARWLRIAGSDEHLQSVIAGMKAKLEDVVAGRTAAALSVRRYVRSQSVALGEVLTGAAQDLSFPRVAQEWGKAQRLLVVDPAGAITAASSLVETALKHVLAALEVPLPPDQSIAPLSKAGMKALGLENGDDRRGIARGLATLVQSVGSLRTKTGDAHGRGPAHADANDHEAALAVNAAGVCVTFLLHRLGDQMRQRSVPPDASTGSNAVSLAAGELPLNRTEFLLPREPETSGRVEQLEVMERSLSQRAAPVGS